MLVSFCIIMGILWTKLFTGFLVDLLTVIGTLTNLSTTYLGLTVLAVGNALPDGLTTISIAKNGQAMMGITGGIAGQLFGLLFGFGTAMLKETLSKGKSLKFDLFNKNSFEKNFLNLVMIVVASCTLLFIFFYGILNKYVFDRKLSYILIGIYVIFISTTTTIAIHQAMK